MNSINLLPKDKQLATTLSVVRRWTILVTSIVLVIYLVVTAGVVGWWLFLATQDSLTTSKIVEAETQIRQVSKTEALVREAGTRAELIQNFLTARPNVASLSASLVPIENVAVSGFSYSAGATSVDVHMSQLDQMEKYTERLKALFPNIVNSTITNSGTPDWAVSVKL